MINLFHINSPITAIVSISYIKQHFPSERVYLFFSRGTSFLSELFDENHSVVLTNSTINSLLDSKNEGVNIYIPHDYVDGKRYLQLIYKNFFNSVIYVEEGDLSHFNTRYHHDRRRIFASKLRLCDIPLIGKVFDKKVYSKDIKYISLTSNAFQFASNRKRVVVPLWNGIAEKYQQKIQKKSFILLLPKFEIEKKLRDACSLLKTLNDPLYLKLHPFVYNNKKMLKESLLIIGDLGFSSDCLLPYDTVLELECINGGVTLIGSESSLFRYSKIFGFNYILI